MCRGLCNPYNQDKIKIKIPEKPKVIANPTSRKQLVLLQKLPDAKGNCKPQQCCVFRYLMMLLLYIIFHVLIGVAAKDTEYYQPFLYTQLCGILALVIWSVRN